MQAGERASERAEREGLSLRSPPPSALRPLSLSHFSSDERKSKFFAIKRRSAPLRSVGHIAGNLLPRAHLPPSLLCSVLFLLFPPQNFHSVEQNLNFLLLRPQNEEPPNHRRAAAFTLFLSLSLPLCFVGSIVRVSPPPPPPFGARRARRPPSL